MPDRRTYTYKEEGKSVVVSTTSSTLGQREFV